MKYKDYYGSVNFNDDDDVFYGRIEFIKALISYEGTDVTSLRKAFQEAVDDFLSRTLDRRVRRYIPIS